MKQAKHGGIEIEDENENEIEEAKLKERKFHFVWNWCFFSEEILGIHERIRIPLPLHYELQTRFHLLLLLLVPATSFRTQNPSADEGQSREDLYRIAQEQMNFSSRSEGELLSVPTFFGHSEQEEPSSV